MIYMKNLALFFLLLITGSAFAVNVENDTVTIEQPDGKSYQMYLTGDEFFMRIHDASGYIITQEPDGYFYYVREWNNDKWIASEFKVGSVNPLTTNLQTWLIPPVEYFERVILPKREIAMKAPPVKTKKMTNGSSTAIIILVKFADQTDFSESFLTSMDSTLNAVNTKSLNKYYKEVSYGKLFLNGHIIRKTYTTPQPRAYFLPYNATTNPTGYVDDSDKNARRSAFLNAAVENVMNELPTGMKHDMNEDGKFDFASFIIRGNAGAWSDLLWPHATSSSFGGKKINGLGFGTYCFLTENKSGLNTFTHEFYHNMGAPDVYRYTNTDISPAPDMFADGSHMNAYYKWKHSEGTWTKEIPEITKPGIYALYPLATNDNSTSKKSAYKIASPYNSSEFFMVEYRQKLSTTVDNALAKSGLITYRVNPIKNGNGGGPPDEIYVYRTGGNYLLNGNKDKHFGGKGLDYEVLNDNTEPGTHLSNGFQGGLNIDSIGTAGDSIVIKVSFTPSTTLISGTKYIISNLASTDSKLARNDANKAITSNTINSDSEWILDYAGDGKWKILAGQNRMALTVPGNVDVAGTEITLSQYKGEAGQLWYIFNTGKNDYRFVSSINKNTCIYNVSGSVKTVTFSSTTASHKWTLKPIGSHIIASKPYRLMAVINGKAAEWNGTTLIQKTWGTSTNQQWIIENVSGTENFKIKSVGSAKYLFSDGSILGANEVGSKWKLILNDTGYYTLMEIVSGKVLTASVTDFGNGIAFSISDIISNSKNQQFAISNTTPYPSDIDPNTLTPDKISSALSILNFGKQTIGNETIHKFLDIMIEKPSTNVNFALKSGVNFKLLSNAVVSTQELFITIPVDIQFLPQNLVEVSDTLIVTVGANTMKIPVVGLGTLFYEPFTRNKATGVSITLEQLNNEYAWNTPWDGKNFKIYVHSDGGTRLDVAIGSSRNGELVSPDIQLEQPFKLTFKGRMILNSTVATYNAKRNFYAIMGNDTLYNHKKTGSTLYQNYVIWSSTFATSEPEPIRFTANSTNSDFATDGLVIGEILIEPTTEPTLNVGKGKMIDLGEVGAGQQFNGEFTLKGWNLTGDVNVTYTNPLFSTLIPETLTPTAEKTIEKKFVWNFTAPTNIGNYVDKISVTGGGLTGGTNDIFVKLKVINATDINLLSDKSLRVYSLNNKLVVESEQLNDIQIFSIEGKSIKRYNKTSKIEVELKQGIYLVRIGNVLQKVVL